MSGIDNSHPSRHLPDLPPISAQDTTATASAAGSSDTANPPSPSAALREGIANLHLDGPASSYDEDMEMYDEDGAETMGSAAGAPTYATTTNNRRSSRLSISTTAADLSAQSSTSKGKKRVSINIEEPAASSSSRKKSKTSATATPATGTTSTITSTDPPTDRKGKKRATSSTTPTLAESPTADAGKRPKRTSAAPSGSTASASRYDLRAKPEDAESPAAAAASGSTTGKGKGKAPAPAKKKMPRKSGLKQSNTGPGGSSNDRQKKGDNSARRLVDDGMEDDSSLWMDEAGGSDGRGLMDDEDEDHMEGYDHDDEDEEDDEDDEDDEEGDENARPGRAFGGFGGNAYDRLARLASESGLNLDDATAALFGGGFRSFGGGMSGLSSRLKRLKTKLRSKKVATRLAALRDCSELLLVSNEDTLGGVFSPNQFASEFIAILDGRPNINEDEDDAEEPTFDEMDEDSQLAAALAISTGGEVPPMGSQGMGGEDEMECQLLACRCLAHLLEALPGTGHTLVQLGAVPVLCSKLTEISYIELAEQTLSTLEKISAEYPGAIVREGGLGALLNYLPFFSTNVQRTAVTAAANCCRNIAGEHHTKIKEVFPILRDTLSSGDQRLVEQATLAVVRTVEAYRHNAEYLEGLLDVPTVTSINSLLMPSGGSPLITPSTYTHLLKALTTSARGSAKVSIAFLEAGMTSTIYQILTGVLPPSHDEDEQGNSSGGQGLAGGVADMAVLQNLAHRPKDQVEEALALICELLPPVPRDGVFDAKAYTEKALHKVKRGKKLDEDKTPRRSSRVAEAAGGSAPSTGTNTPTPGGASAAAAVPLPNLGDFPVIIGGPSSLNREAALFKAKKDVEAQMELHLELCKANTELLGKSIKAVVPVLVDVFAASVVLRVRTKVLVGLVKAIAFAPQEQLRATLRSVPMASFLCAIVSSKDNQLFALHALQIVELLVTKLPDVYQVSFLREGVVFEIDALAKSETTKEKEVKAAAAAATAAAVKAEPGNLEAGASAPAPAPAPASAAGPSDAFSAPPAISEDLRSLLAISGMPGSSLAVMGEAATPKKSSSTLDPRDANIIRARMLRAKKVFETGGDHKKAATQVLTDIDTMVLRLLNPNAREVELRELLRGLSLQFVNEDQSLSSYELLKSGLVDGLLQFADIDGGDLTSAERREMLFSVFSNTAVSSPSPLVSLVKRLHESLGRLENFAVETAFGGGADPSRPTGGSGVGRTVRIKLLAEEGSDIPKQVSAMNITVQAIASIKTVHEYLRPRIADGSLGLSQMFAAYAAGVPVSGGGPGSGTSRLLSALAASSASREGLSSSAPAGGSRPAIPPPADARPATPGQASGSAPAPTSSTPASAPATSKTRRRSARLSAAQTGAEAEAPAPAASANPATPRGPSPTGNAAAGAGPLSASAPAEGERRPMLPGMPLDMDFDDDDYSEDDYEAPVIDQVMEDEITGPPESVVNMNVTADGSRVEAKTPQGTRVATPSQNTPAAGGSSTATGGGPGPRSASYAGALKTEPSNWHLEFFLNGVRLKMEDTVYGALFKHLHAQGGAGPAAFNIPVVITFKKVEGPVPTKETDVEASPGSTTSALPAGLEPDNPTSRILRLLRLVHNLSVEGRETLGASDAALTETLFVNNKLTAKLTRQLEETLVIASNCLPEWADELPKHFSFLFPFDTRYAFLQSTSFGYTRLILKAQQSSRHRDDLNNLIHLMRRKVRISRTQLLESCAKVMEMYAVFPGTLEVEYFDEIGTGLGPTLEFYSLASKEFAKRSLLLWRDEDESKPGKHVYHPKGLFPAPMQPGETNAARINWFKTLGLFIGRALLDLRIIDVSLNSVFLKLLLEKPVKKTIAILKAVDLPLARSLERLQSYLSARKEIEALPLPASSRRSKLAALTVSGAKLADLSLDFTLPGYNIELVPGGAAIEVDDSNLEEYLEKVLDMTLGSGVEQQVKAFRDGFSSIFPIKNMQIFSLDELSLLLGNAEEDWSRETIKHAIKADHGYNLDSRSVQNLIDVMVAYTRDERRQFLQFITGAPKLPIGGFRGLTPPFTVVRKPHEPPFKADDYLPSVMTCAQYLKMPDYSSKEVLAAQISRAVRDGGGAFLLS